MSASDTEIAICPLNRITRHIRFSSGVAGLQPILTLKEQECKNR